MQIIKPFTALTILGLLLVTGGIVSLFMTRSFAEKEYWFAVFLFSATAGLLLFLEAFVYHYTKSYRQIPWLAVIHIGCWGLAVLLIWGKIITDRFASGLPIYLYISILSIGHLAFGVNLVAGFVRGKQIKT
ncbi:hypothetical protein WJU16_13405 [Chitinophaga pollutisoli]|uniref:Uncharacterized protein n=1 Tax=Chitinophaga pollutisoli TaxID=3133966 RepID=A0ABZ2YGM8_9BACT